MATKEACCLLSRQHRTQAVATKGPTWRSPASLQLSGCGSFAWHNVFTSRMTGDDISSLVPERGTHKAPSSGVPIFCRLNKVEPIQATNVQSCLGLLGYLV